MNLIPEVEQVGAGFRTENFGFAGRDAAKSLGIAANNGC